MVHIHPPAPQDSRATCSSHVTIEASEPGETLLALDKILIKDLYKRHGAILFRGFHLDLTTFKQLTSHFCSHGIVNAAGRRELVDDEGNIQTVNRGERPFPLHPELSTEPWRPDICWFACDTPPEQGGETIICDGVRLAQELPTEVVSTLTTRRLKYSVQMTLAEYKFWLKSDTPNYDQLRDPPPGSPYQFFVAENRMMRSFSTPALHKPMFSEEMAFGNFLLFARYFLDNKNFPTYEDDSLVSDDLVATVKKVSDELTLAIKWQRNDVLMLDNTRFMHGRNQVLDLAKRYIWTYFGYLKFAIPGEDEPQDPPWRHANETARAEFLAIYGATDD